MVLGRERERWAAEAASAAARTKRLGLVQREVALCSQAAAGQASLDEVRGLSFFLFSFRNPPRKGKETAKTYIHTQMHHQASVTLIRSKLTALPALMQGPH